MNPKLLRLEVVDEHARYLNGLLDIGARALAGCDPLLLDCPETVTNQAKLRVRRVMFEFSYRSPRR
ncbi:MAG: hypothetical protein ACR2LM_12115 [Pyrinomonadaceae bacterium]